MQGSLCLRLAVGSLLVISANPVRAEEITLSDALRRAASRPSIESGRLQVETARALARHAGRRPYSPELGVEAGPRLVGGQALIEGRISISQTFELGGKGAARKGVADADLRLSERALGVLLQGAHLDAWRAFQLALLARERLLTAEEAESLAVQVDQATQERQRLGAGTRLEANLTTAELGRARHDRLDAERRKAAAIAALAAAIGATADEVLEPTGQVDSLPELGLELEQLKASALRARGDLKVAQSAVVLAERQVRAADTLRASDLTLGLSYGFEQDPAGSAHVVAVNASIGLPTGIRGQGVREAARVREKQAMLDLAWTTTEVAREVNVAFVSYRKTREAVLGFDREVNERLHENLGLAQESFASGKIDYYEFNVVRRELIANRLAYLDAVEEAIEARAELHRVTGAEVSP